MDLIYLGLINPAKTAQVTQSDASRAILSMLNPARATLSPPKTASEILFGVRELPPPPPVNRD